MNHRECPDCGFDNEIDAHLPWWQCSNCGRGWVFLNHCGSQFMVPSDILKGTCPKCGHRLKAAQTKEAVAKWGPPPPNEPRRGAELSVAKRAEMDLKVRQLRLEWWNDTSVMGQDNTVANWTAKCIEGHTSLQTANLIIGKKGVAYGVVTHKRWTWPEIESFEVGPARKERWALLTMTLQDGSRQVYEVHKQPLVVEGKLRPIREAMQTARNLV